MFSTLRNRFGIPGVISVIALVFAMFGGAYAASNSSGGGKATASKAKAKRGPVGPKGATGPAGPAGPAGPQGPAGANGKDGSNGSNGAAGATGATGKSVVIGSANGLECEAGGATAEVSGEPATKKAICNGEEGPRGPQGQPWTDGGTLPEGSTEKGAWSFGRTAATAGAGNVDISFTIPLSHSLDSAHVHYINPAGKELTGLASEEELEEGKLFKEEVSTKCLGSALEPTAVSGHLCVYAAFVQPTLNGIFNATIRDPGQTALTSGASAVGAGMTVLGNSTEARGTWAVTG